MTLSSHMQDDIAIIREGPDPAHPTPFHEAVDRLVEQFEVLETALQKIADNCEVVEMADGWPSIVYGGIDFRAVAAEALAAVRNPAKRPT